MISKAIKDIAWQLKVHCVLVVLVSFLKRQSMEAFMPHHFQGATHYQSSHSATIQAIEDARGPRTMLCSPLALVNSRVVQRKQYFLGILWSTKVI